jgi:hypothetical protein
LAEAGSAQSNAPSKGVGLNPDRFVGDAKHWHKNPRGANIRQNIFNRRNCRYPFVARARTNTTDWSNPQKRWSWWS